MSSRLRLLCLAGVFVGSAAVLAVGCSDDTTKKVPAVSGEAGEAGEATGGTSASGGKGGTGGAGGTTVITPEGGAAGEPTGTEGGAAGATVTPPGGAAGEAGAAGAAGSGPLACTTNGDATGVKLGVDNEQTACRGAVLVTDFSASSADDSFTCCGTTGTYQVTVSGVVDNREGTIGGQLSVVVPADAPSGGQSITVTCSGGVATNTFDLNVNTEDAPAPVEASGPIYETDNLQITGTHLDGVTNVTAVMVGDPFTTANCQIDAASSTASLIVCSFNGDIQSGDYTLVVSKDCGSATNTPAFTVLPPP